MSIEKHATFELTPEVAEAFLELADLDGDALQMRLEEHHGLVRTALEQLLALEVEKDPFQAMDKLPPAGSSTLPEFPAMDSPQLATQDVKILREIGRGGMGIVYLGLRTKLQQLVAIKVLSPELTASRSARERIEREARAIGRLAHPGIVKVYDIATEPRTGAPCFLMEHLAARSLADLIQELLARDTGPPTGMVLMRALDPSFEDETLLPDAFRGSWIQIVCGLTRQVAEALDHAHQNGVVHRDIKPSNIMLTPEGRAVLIDFGIARDEEVTRLTLTGDLAGSLPYVAPERLETPRAAPSQPTHEALQDVYGLGLTLLELLTLRPAFQAATMAALLEQIQQGIKQARIKAPRDVRLVCLRASDVDPLQRYGSAKIFALELARLVRGETPEARPLPATLRAWRLIRTHQNLTMAIAGAILVIGAATIFWWKSSRERERKARDVTYQTSTLLGRAEEGLLSENWQRALEALEAIDLVPGQEMLDAEISKRVAHAKEAAHMLREHAARDRAMVERLHIIHAGLGVDPTYRAPMRDYRMAFREYGLSFSSDAAEASLARLRDSAIHEELIRGLDAYLGLAIGRDTRPRDSRPEDPLIGTGKPIDFREFAKALATVDKKPERARARTRFLHSPEEYAGTLAASQTVNAIPPSILVLAARQLAAAGRDDAAIEILDRGRDFNPRDFVLHLTLAEMIRNQAPLDPRSLARAAEVTAALRGAYPESLVLLSNLIALHSDLTNSPQLSEEAKARHHRSVEELATFLLQRDEDHAFTLHNRALSRSYREQYAKALEDFDRLVQLRTPKTLEWALAMHDRGYCLAMLSRPREALPAFLQAVDAFPNNNRFLQSLGRCQMVLQKWDPALQTFERIPASWPDYSAVQHFCLRILITARRFEEVVHKGSTLESEPWFGTPIFGVSARMLAATSAVHLLGRIDSQDMDRRRSVLNRALDWFLAESRSLEPLLERSPSQPQGQHLGLWTADPAIGKLKAIQDELWLTPEQRAKCRTLMTWTARAEKKVNEGE